VGLSGSGYGEVARYCLHTGGEIVYVCNSGRLKKGCAAWHLVNGSHIETLEF
jgi:hypothetical protein